MIQWLREMLGYRMTASPADSGAASLWAPGGRKKTIRHDEAMTLSSVFAAMHTLANTVAALPINLYQTDGVTRTIDMASPVQRLLHDEANPLMTSFTFRHVMETWLLATGNAFAEITYRGIRGVDVVPESLWPIDPRRVDVVIRGGEVAYDVYRDGRDKAADVLSPRDVIHLRVNSLDGIVGRSFLDYAATSLGQAISLQEYAKAFFENSARPGGILTHAGTPSEDARKKLREQWDAKHGGTDGAHRTAVLWGGWQYAPDGSTDPDRSQLIQQRQFTVEEVARWLNLPPHMLRDLRYATYSNIEQQSLDFVIYSLGPILANWEQELRRRLCRPTQYVKFNVSALLRGDTAARSAFYREMFGIGVLSINEIRELEDRNPIEGGDRRFVPLNMGDLNEPAPPVPPQ